MTAKIQFPRAGKYGQMRSEYAVLARACPPIDLLVMALNALERAALPLEILQERQDQENVAEAKAALKACIENHVQTWGLVLEAIQKQEMAVELAEVGLRTSREQKLDS